MKIEKNKILKFVISTILSLFITMFITTSSGIFSTVFCLDIFILFNFFINVLINVKDRFFPISFFLISIFLGFLDIVFVACNIRYVSQKYSMYIYEKCLLLLIIWICAFLFAYFIKSKRIKKTNIKAVKIINNVIYSINMNYLLVISIIIQLFVAYKVIITVYLVGGINIAMNDFAVFRYNNQGYLALLFPLLSIVTICFYEKNCKKLSFLSMIVNFALITITGRRGLAINTVLIPLLVYYNYKIRKIDNKIIFFVMIPVIVFIIVVGNVRNQQVNYTSNNNITRALIYLTNTIQYGQNLPDLVYKMDNGFVKFQHGKYVFNGILGMVPRAIWKDKPESDNSLITSRVIYYSDITYGKPVGAFGFAYFCYGYIGVFISGLICGYLSCLLYNWMSYKKNIISILIYSTLIQSFIYITNPDSQTKVITLFLIFVIISFITSIKNGKIILLKGDKYEIKANI